MAMVLMALAFAPHFGPDLSCPRCLQASFRQQINIPVWRSLWYWLQKCSGPLFPFFFLARLPVLCLVITSLRSMNQHHISDTHTPESTFCPVSCLHSARATKTQSYCWTRLPSLSPLCKVSERTHAPTHNNPSAHTDRPITFAHLYPDPIPDLALDHDPETPTLRDHFRSSEPLAPVEGTRGGE